MKQMWQGVNRGLILVMATYVFYFMHVFGMFKSLNTEK